MNTYVGKKTKWKLAEQTVFATLLCFCGCLLSLHAAASVIYSEGRYIYIHMYICIYSLYIYISRRVHGEVLKYCYALRSKPSRSEREAHPERMSLSITICHHDGNTLLAYICCHAKKERAMLSSRGSHLGGGCYVTRNDVNPPLCVVRV